MASKKNTTVVANEDDNTSAVTPDTADNKSNITPEEYAKELEKIIAQQTEVIESLGKKVESLEKTIDDIKTVTSAEAEASAPERPSEIAEREAQMREIVEVFITENPLDPATDVPVLNPVTERVDKIKKGEWVKVNRATREILQYSMAADKATAMLTRELSEKFKADTESLPS